MNAVLLNTFEGNGGAAIATKRIHQGLLSLGVNSRLMVQTRSTDDPTVVRAGLRLQGITAMVRTLLDEWVLWLYPRRDRIFSRAAVPDRLPAHAAKLEADLVHLFWISSGFLRIESVKRFRCPVIWTLHDMWPMTGGCHYDDECRRFEQSCGQCPALGSKRDRDLSRRIWRRKHRAWASVPIVVVATSHWLADMARSSSLFREKRIEVIPNGLDTEVYKPIDKRAARHAYGLPQDKHLALFSAFGATRDKRKGNQFLVPALEQLAAAGYRDNTELVVIGASGPAEGTVLGMKVHYISRLHDEISQVLLYSAADVTVAPSMQENLSNTVMESLACGTPVVAFRIGGMPDMIEHERNGYLAHPFEPGDLARGMAFVLEDEARRAELSRAARQSVLDRFTLKAVATRYLELYRSVLA